MIICLDAPQDFLVVNEMVEKAAVDSNQVRLEMTILASVIAQIGLSALMAIPLLEYQVSLTLRSCVIAGNSQTRFSLIQHLFHQLSSDVATWLILTIHKFLQGQASRQLELIIQVTALMFMLPLMVIFVVSERAMELLVQLSPHFSQVS